MEETNTKRPCKKLQQNKTSTNIISSSIITDQLPSHTDLTLASLEDEIDALTDCFESWHFENMGKLRTQRTGNSVEAQRAVKKKQISIKSYFLRRQNNTKMADIHDKYKASVNDTTNTFSTQTKQVVLNHTKYNHSSRKSTIPRHKCVDTDEIYRLRKHPGRLKRKSI